jgi:erythromycin esterase
VAVSFGAGFGAGSHFRISCDANALAMPVRLVRFLHERLDFDVLAFESGFYASDAGWRDIVSGRPAAEVMAETVLPNYSQSEAFQPLLEYVDTQARGGRPLHLAGYGLLGSLTLGEPHLVVDLRAALRACRAPDLDSTTIEILRNLTHETYAMGHAKLPTRSQRKAFGKEVDRLRSLFETSVSCSVEVDLGLWARAMESLGAAAVEAWDMGVFDPAHPGIDPAITTRSYRQQAANLLWILKRPVAHPNTSPHKVIVWSMTIQFVRNLDLLTTGDPAARKRFDQLTTLGDLVHKRLGDKAYTWHSLHIKATTDRFPRIPMRCWHPPRAPSRI